MLRKKAISATLWSAADLFLRQGLSFIISIVLARLLEPEDFGTISLLYLFTGLASLFVDSGFSDSLIQGKDVSHSDETTIFWFNLGMGALMALGLWGGAPWIADFFNTPILVPLIWVMALNLFISSLGSVHTTLLTKRLDFKTPMKIGAISTIVSGIVGIVMAWRGYGVWALAAQTLSFTLITTGLLWGFCAWRPRLEFSFATLRKLFNFGGYLLLTGLLNVFHNRIYTLLIGKLYGARDLGLYNRADGIRMLLPGVLTTILSRVAFPVFARVADDKNLLLRGLRQAVRGAMMINVPMMLGLMATADNLVPALFGQQWRASVPILQVLCLTSILWPLHILNFNVLIAQGYSQKSFKLELVKKTIGIAILFLSTTFGVMGIAWGRVIYEIIAFFINTYYTNLYLGYGAKAQIFDFFPIFALSVAMALAVYSLGKLLIWESMLILIVQIVIGTVIFFLGCQLFRLRAYLEAIQMLRGHISDVH